MKIADTKALQPKAPAKTRAKLTRPSFLDLKSLLKREDNEKRSFKESSFFGEDTLI